MTKVGKKTWLTSKRLSTHQLTQIHSSDIELNIDELFTSEPESRGTTFFLGFYSPSGIKYALKQYGVIDDLKKRGFENLKLVLNTRDPFQQRFSIFYDKQDRDHLLVELVVKRKEITLYTDFHHSINGKNCEFLFVEWLCLQNPQNSFTPVRPILPGQMYPGLGSGKMAFQLLLISAKRLRLAGLLAVPEYYHNAQMYSKKLYFVKPDHEGKRCALERDLLKKSNLSTVSWAIEKKCVLENGKKFEWFTSEVVLPLDNDIKNYINSEEYKKIVEKTMQQYTYSIKTERWDKIKEKISNHGK
jgi:hypothetical protein